MTSFQHLQQRVAARMIAQGLQRKAITTCSKWAEKYRKIVFLDENGKPEEALAKKQRLVSALKKDFRKEIDI